MATIKCSGKCNECESFLNSEIESFESCAIAAINRRTFDMTTKINNLEQLLFKFIEENQEKKGKKSVPVKSNDSINAKKEKNNEVSDLQQGND